MSFLPVDPLLWYSKVMIFWLALAAAFGCAVCNGIAAVLQKTSADKETRATSINVGLLWRLIQDWPYVVGLMLDGLAWILTLVAVHTLPLFVVQPIIAFSVVITALIDRFVLGRRLGGGANVAMLCIFAGLALLALTAAPERARAVNEITRWAIISAPLLLGLAGSVFAKVQKPYATIVLGAISGVAFGGTAVVGRILNFSQPYWHLLFNPLVWALLAYGLVGILLFTIALQRHHASVVNAAMIAFETLAPITIGIFLLGDTPKNGSWGYVIAGASLAFVGTTLITTARHER